MWSSSNSPGNEINFQIQNPQPKTVYQSSLILWLFSLSISHTTCFKWTELRSEPSKSITHYKNEVFNEIYLCKELKSNCQSESCSTNDWSSSAASIRCRFSSSGCPYRLPSMEDHEERECRFRPTRCPSLTCSAKPAFSNLLKHIEVCFSSINLIGECRFRPTRCPSLTCSVKPAFSNLLKHIEVSVYLFL